MEGEQQGNYIYDSKGRAAFVGLESFTKKVVTGKVCYQCAKDLTIENRSEEHVIPKWLLRRFDLFNRTINLPNGTRFKYEKYTLPCCQNCNGLLSKVLEDPLSRLLNSGYDGLMGNLNEFLCHKIFFWLANLFTKTHIKDNSLRMSLDFRGGDKSIAEGVERDWIGLHHTYMLSRIPYTQAIYSDSCIGSMFITRVDPAGTDERFDYFDFSHANTAVIIIGDIGIVVVFDDAGAVYNALYEPFLSNLEGPMTSIQVRELIARFACCNMHIENSPKFSTMLIPISSQESIASMHASLDVNGPKFEKYEPRLLGMFMDYILGDVLEGRTNIDNFRDELRKGGVSFILDRNNNHIPPEQSCEFSKPINS